MKTVLSKLKDALPVIGRGGKRSEKVASGREMEKNSTTSGTIEPVVWIMSGLLLSLVAQIAAVNLQQRHGVNLETKEKHD